MNTTKIIIGCDHGGFELKNQIIAYLKSKNVECDDVGTYTPDSVDYPVYADKLCKKIQNKEAELGILVCGTGIGMSMSANKHKGIRAAAVSEVYSARLTRMHNNANVLCLGGRVVGPGLACDIVDAFVFTDFEGGRHQKRVDMFMALEEEK